MQTAHGWTPPASVVANVAAASGNRLLGPGGKVMTKAAKSQACLDFPRGRMLWMFKDIWSQFMSAREAPIAAFRLLSVRAKHSWSSDMCPTQRVPVGIWYILRAQMGSHIPTSRPKYIPYATRTLWARSKCQGLD